LRYISLAQRQTDQQQPEKAKDCLQRCREGLLRMAQIVGDLLEYSRGMPIPLGTYPLEQLVQEAIRTAEARWTGPVSIEVRQSYGSDIPVIRRGNLFQVFCNIIKNAYDAMPAGGRLEIEGSVTGEQVLVMAFRDTGPGFAPQDMDMLFEPFFTTKEHGTGLGLAVCKDIVQRYKGRIDAQNAAEGGAIVTIRLPLAEII
jgi:signal transduction histidine kinase